MHRPSAAAQKQPQMPSPKMGSYSLAAAESRWNFSSIDSVSASALPLSELIKIPSTILDLKLSDCPKVI